MKILTAEIKKKLLANGKNSDKSGMRPVLKLFNPMGAQTWIFSELDEDQDTLFGLCDLGMQSPELGYASLSEIMNIRLSFGLKIERDMHFTANKTLDGYAEDARTKQRIDA
jgi:hypothetical protein